MGALSRFIIKHRVIVIVTVLLITAIFGLFLPRIKINSDVLSYLPKKNPEVKIFDYIGEEYGGNLTAIVAVESDDIFKKEILQKINELTSRFKGIDGIASVASITNVIDIKKTAGGIEIGKLIDPEKPADNGRELQKIKNYTLSKSMYNGRFISGDGKTCVIICRLGKDADKVKTSQMIRETVVKSGINEKVYYGGIPFIIAEIGNIIVDDLKILIPVISILFIITLFLSFRRPAGVILPLVSVLISIIWTVGTMCIFRIPLSIVSDIIPVILIAVGSAYGIHIVNKFSEDKSEPFDKAEHAEKALREIGKPVMLAGVTTIAGFASFIFGSYLKMIMQFGLFSALGVLFALLISLTFIPAVLAVTGRPAKKPAPGKEHARKTAIEKFTGHTAKLAINHRKAVLFGAIILMIISVFGIRNVTRKVEFLDYFRPGSGIRATEQMLKEKFGGSVPVQILVRGDIQDPAVLDEIVNMEQFLGSIEYVGNTQSVAGLIEEMNDVMGEGKKIPDSREKVSNLWFLLEGEESLSQLVNPEMTEAVIHATIPNLDTDQMKDLVGRINSHIKTANGSGAEFTQTGLPVIYRELDNSIIKSQLSSLVIALVLVFICLIFLLRSVIGGLIGMIPITITIVFIFAIMGFSRIPLDIATVLVGGIAIGIGIDYSIHIASRFGSEYKNGRSMEEAASVTLQTSGKGIIINVLTVTIGFLVLLFSNLIPLQRFGFLVALTMVISGLSAMTLLLAVIILTIDGFFGKRFSGMFSRGLAAAREKNRQ